MEKLKNSCLIISHSDIAGKSELVDLLATVSLHRISLPDLLSRFLEYSKRWFGKTYAEVSERHLAEFRQSEEEAFSFCQNKNVMRMFDVLIRITIEHFESCLKFFEESDARFTKKEGKWEKEPLLKKKRFFSFFKVLRELREGFVCLHEISEDDLFIQPRDSERWKALDSITTVVEVDNKEKCLESIFKRAQGTLALWATVGKEAQFLPKTEKDMDTIMEKFAQCSDVLNAKGFEFVKKVDQKNRENSDDVGFRFMVRMNHYKNNEVKCLTDGLFMIAQADDMLVQKMFNFIDKGVIKFFRKTFEYPSVEHNVKMYLKPNILEDSFRYDKRSPIRVKSSLILFDQEELLPATLTVKDEEAIRIRFLCDSKLKNFESRVKSTTKAKSGKDSPTRHSPTKQNSPLQAIPMESFSPSIDQIAIQADCEVTQPWLEPAEQSVFDNVLIYMHGGGFVSMSSSSHQNYLRRWAKELKLPIFAIDYRLAPATKYPELPNDVFRSYVWILAFLTQVLKVNPKKIIVSGDSAGGNLCALLTTWCIENKVRKPDYVMMSYPATDLNIKRFTPSLVHAFGDFLLNYNGLRMCSRFYIPEWADSKTDYYLSPIYTPKEVLSQYPPCSVLVTERDPLNDDGLRLASRMQEANAQVSVFYFKNLIHGQLNFAVSNEMGIPEALKFEEKARSLLAAAMS